MENGKAQKGRGALLKLMICEDPEVNTKKVSCITTPTMVLSPTN